MTEPDQSMIVEQLAQACESAATGDFESVVSVASSLRQLAEGPDDPLRAVIAGLEYHLVLDPAQQGADGPYGPMIESDQGAYPAPVSRVEELAPGTLGIWDLVSRSAPLALVRARFADLLWEAQSGETPYRYALDAIDNYLEAATDSFGHPVERSEGLQRALQLASIVNAKERREAVVVAMVALIEASVASDERSPGVALPLLELLVTLPERTRPNDLQSLVEAAIVRFGDNPWNLESALEIYAQLPEISDQEAVRARQIQAFRDLAQESDGLARYAHLQHALSLAEDHELSGLTEDIRRDIESLGVDDLDLKSVSTEISFPRAEIDRIVSTIVGEDELGSALGRFGSSLPTGDVDQNRTFVEQMMTEHPLQYLVTRVVIGPENSLLRELQGPEAQAEQALIDHEVQRASMFSLFAVDMLEGMAARYGRLGPQIPALFETVLIEAPVAAAVGRAIELYEAGDFDSAACVLAPRLERVVRRMVASTGQTVTKSPTRSGTPGGVKGLGALLAQLQGLLEESARRYLKVLLVEVTGLNLRNRVGHGLNDRFAQRDVALLIHAACFLRLLGPQPAEVNEGS